jgi:hypothetical protein
VKSAAVAAAEEATIEEMEPPLSGCCGGGESPAGAGVASDMAVERLG